MTLDIDCNTTLIRLTAIPVTRSITVFIMTRLDRMTGIADALTTHTTNFDYNDRGQVMAITLPWYQRLNAIPSRNLYNPDGTLQM